MKLLYKLGVAFRNPSLFPSLDFLQKTDKWSLEELHAYQLKKLKDLLLFAYNYSDYYRTEFDKINFEPETLCSLGDLKKLPIIDKSILLNNSDTIHTNYRFKKIFFSETSGTSGQVLKFFRNEEWESGHRAAMFRGYSWYNVSPWDKNGYFWGYNIDRKKVIKIRFLDFLQNRFRLFSYQREDINCFCRKMQKAKYVGGYSSMIYEVAKAVNLLKKQGREYHYNLKMIKGTSEKIFDSYQEEVRLAFGSKIISEYGSAESGIIAFECPEGGHMHICMENVIVEEINGEIVITNLLSYSFPVIRYKLGDYVKLAGPEFKCSCGRAHSVILDVLGRVGKNVYGKHECYPSLTFYYVFKNLTLSDGITLNYQAIQNEKGKITINIEQDSSQYEEALRKELRKYFKDDICFEIHFSQKLHSYQGKLKDFVSYIN